MKNKGGRFRILKNKVKNFIKLILLVKVLEALI